MLKKVMPWRVDQVNGNEYLDVVAFGSHKVVTADYQILPNCLLETDGIKQISENDLTYSQRGTTWRPNDADERLDAWAYRNDGWGMSDSYTAYIKSGVID